MEHHHRRQGRLLCRDLKIRHGGGHHWARQPDLQLPLRHLPQLCSRVSSLPYTNLISAVRSATGRRLVRYSSHRQLRQQNGRRSEQAPGSRQFLIEQL